jgi:dTDP-4-dehydrorhamnose 3,5-epimerase
MKATPLAIPDVMLLEPKVHGDARGFFLESWNRRVFTDAIGRDVEFVQDNHSTSVRGVLRGLHYQVVRPQCKLVRVVEGEVFDVAVDLRRSSPTFGRWVGERLSAENHRMMWIPEGFAHGFLVLSGRAQFLYKTGDYYAPEGDRSLRWNDPTVEIRWPLDGEPKLSAKDVEAPLFEAADKFP